MAEVILITQSKNLLNAVAQVHSFFRSGNLNHGDTHFFTEYHRIGSLHEGLLFPAVKTFKKIVFDKLQGHKAFKNSFLSDNYLPKEITTQYKEWLNITWKTLEGIGDHCFIEKNDHDYHEYSVRPLLECQDLVEKHYINYIETGLRMEQASLKNFHTDLIKRGELPNWEQIGRTKLDVGKIFLGHFVRDMPFYNIYQYNYKWPSSSIKDWWAIEVEYQ